MDGLHMSKINWIKVSNEKGEQVGAISQEYWDYANKVIDEAFEEAIKELEKDLKISNKELKKLQKRNKKI